VATERGATSVEQSDRGKVSLLMSRIHYTRFPVDDEEAANLLRNTDMLYGETGVMDFGLKHLDIV